MRNKLKFIRNVIYKAKRSYGLPIDYYQTVAHTMDKADGIKTTELRRVRINRAVVLRAREFRSFVYDLAFISANKDFTTGGFFDPEDRRVVIDVNDLPADFEPRIDDYFIFQDRKYEVKEKFSFENNYAYILLARHILGSPIVRIEEAVSVLNIQQSVSGITTDRLSRTVESVLNLTQTLNEVP
jgi:hypothetical protein